VVGASQRPGSVGNQVIRQLQGGGFPGRILPVNPRHDQVEGIECLDSLALAGPVDLAVLALSNDQLERSLQDAITNRARSLAIFASCFGEASDGRPLAARLVQLARQGGIPVCGGNGMGYVNLDRQLRVTGFYQPFDLITGGVTFLTHSGSLFSAMLHNHRNIRFNLVVSTGNELTTRMDDYIAYSLSMETTAVIGLFLETVRDTQGMATALTAAAEKDVPVVALKVGRTGRSKKAVATHSAALAGEYEAFTAFASAYNVHLVATMDEMADTLELFSQPRRAGPGGLGTVHDSGGERSLLIDIADRVGVPLASISQKTRDRLGEVLDPGLEPDNPVDAWGTGRDAANIFSESLHALATDDAVGVVAFSVDLTAEESPEGGYGQIPIEVASSTNKPVVVLGNLAGSIDPVESALLHQAGIPVLRGTETGMRAIGHLLTHRDRTGRMRGTVGPPPSTLELWKARLATGATLDEAASLDLLSDFGLPVVSSTKVRGLGDALNAAEACGYPIALKISGVAHKSEAGGVILGVDKPASLIRAWETLAPLSEDLVVQPMAPRGVELALGVVRDELFGPIVVIAAGGVMIEVLADRVTALPPIDPETARRLLGDLKIAALLDGNRGSPARDLDAAAAAIVRMGDLAVHLGHLVDSIDLNPLILLESGCVAVDALAVGRASPIS
jgi:acyl-CoA synthetase (NDP forming)